MSKTVHRIDAVDSMTQAELGVLASLTESSAITPRGVNANVGGYDLYLYRDERKMVVVTDNSGHHLVIGMPGGLLFVGSDDSHWARDIVEALIVAAP